MAVIILKAWLIWGAGNRGSRWLIYLFSFWFHFSFNLGFRSPQTPVGNIRFPPVEIRGTAESSDNTLSDRCWTKALQTLRDNEFGDCDFDVPISLLIDRKAGTWHCSLPRLLSFDSVFQMWFFFFLLAFCTNRDECHPLPGCLREVGHQIYVGVKSPCSNYSF